MLAGNITTGPAGRLVSIPTSTTPLDGMYYLPEKPVRGAVQLLHGNAMNFYVGHSRWLVPALLGAGFACLAYNRRGHDTLSTRNSREPEGNAFQTAAQAREDNELAGDWLRAQGFGAPTVIGHSNGGMLSVAHVAEHPDTPALVLLSAHRGGTDLVRIASRNGLLARDRLDHFTALAHELVASGRGDELMLLPGWWNVLSAASFVDLLTETPDILELAPRISCPVLYLRGDAEPAVLYPAEDFAQRSSGPCEVEIVEGCDHFYNGVEDTVSARIVQWLSATLGA